MVPSYVRSAAATALGFRVQCSSRRKIDKIVRRLNDEGKGEYDRLPGSCAQRIVISKAPCPRPHPAGLFFRASGGHVARGSCAWSATPQDHEHRTATTVPRAWPAPPAAPAPDCRLELSLRYADHVLGRRSLMAACAATSAVLSTSSFHKSHPAQKSSLFGAMPRSVRSCARSSFPSSAASFPASELASTCSLRWPFFATRSRFFDVTNDPASG